MKDGLEALAFLDKIPKYKDKVSEVRKMIAKIESDIDSMMFDYKADQAGLKTEKYEDFDEDDD